MTTRIYSHNPNSHGAKLLAQALGIRRVRHVGSTWAPIGRDAVVNWGSARPLPESLRVCGRIFNDVPSVAQVSNKLSFFQGLDGKENPPRVPEWTSDPDQAKAWLAEGRTKVVARTVLAGHSGAGIRIIEAGVDFCNAPLYTKYVPKKDEYRVHIVNGEVIDVQRKALSTDFQGERNAHVRNLASGYVYVRGGVDPPDDVLTQALRSFVCSGLDFGAVDIIWNERRGLAYVLEINTAPGLTGTSITNYANAFRKHGYV